MPSSDSGSEMEEVVLPPTRGLRYAELFAVGEEWITVYNSMGLSEAPAELWDPLDPAEAASQLGAKVVIKNGPHWWAADRTTLEYGTEEFWVGGIGYRIAARLPAALAQAGSLKPPRYTVVEANKSGELVYESGSPLYELALSDEGLFVMQSANVEPSEWDRLAERLEPASGWEARARIPDQDLVVPLDGKVRVVMDDLGNVYNAAAA